MAVLVLGVIAYTSNTDSADINHLFSPLNCIDDRIPTTVMVTIRTNMTVPSYGRC